MGIRRFRLWHLAVAGLLFAVACTPSQPAPTAPAQPPAQPKTAPAQPKAAPAQPKAPAEAKAAPKEAAKPTADEEWQRIVEAAKQEGRVTVLDGTLAEGTRIAFAEGFQRQYPEIDVEWQSGGSSALSAKLTTEQSANQFLNDLMISGTTTLIASLGEAHLDPLRPHLVGPDVSDPSIWFGGDYPFKDEAQQRTMSFSGYAKEAFVVNADELGDVQFTSWWDMLEPQYRGMVVTQDPLRPGPANSQALFAYTNPELGEEFLRRLWGGEHETLILDDGTQAVDGVARGRYSIGYGLNNPQINEAIKRGLPIRQIDGHDMKEGTYITTGAGNIGVPKNPPNPNALKVFLNYILGPEAQAAYVQHSGFASFRQDVPPEGVFTELVPKPGVSYVDQSTEAMVRMRDQVRGVLTEILGR